MVEYTEQQLDRLFQALADRTRRALLQRLQGGACTVGELARPFSVSLAAISKHLKVLERAGLVRRRTRGVTHHMEIDWEALQGAEDWLASHTRFWRAQLGRMQQRLEADHAAAANTQQNSGEETT